MSLPGNGPGVQTPTRPDRPRDGLISAPTWLSVVPDAIPRELTDATSWYPAIIRAKAGKVGVWDKIPGDPKTGPYPFTVGLRLSVETSSCM